MSITYYSDEKPSSWIHCLQAILFRLPMMNSLSDMHIMEDVFQAIM